MDIAELNQKHAIANHVAFREIADGMPAAEISNAHAKAGIALQGAHLYAWQPDGHEPVIWLSEFAKFAPGKSLRGGIPVCWPWFGPHDSDSKLPAHGYARTSMWDVVETAALPDGSTQIRFELAQTNQMREQWPHAASVQLQISVGRTLQVSLITANTGDSPFTLGEALHTYFRIGDVSNVAIRGLDGCSYIDKVADAAHQVQHGDIVIDNEVDRVYLDTDADCIIEDRGLKRAIRIAKQGSHSTVVWNPWIEKAEKMGDLGEDGYRAMVCVESANALDNVVSIAPNETHHLSVIYSVEPLD